jgi:hypothetical protein
MARIMNTIPKTQTSALKGHAHTRNTIGKSHTSALMGPCVYLHRNIQYAKNAEGDLGEMPIPEQWQHRIKGDLPNLSLENAVSDLYA